MLHHIPELDIKERYEEIMSKSEDYLEQLLKGMDESEETELDLDENFFDEDLLDMDLLDKEFADGDLTEDFLKNFEMALEEMDEKNASGNGFAEDLSEETAFVEDLLGNLDSIISGTSDISETSNEDFVVEDFSYDDVGADALSATESVEEIPMSEITQQPQADNGEADILKILEGLGDLDLELEMDTDAADERSEENKANDDALLDFLAGGAMAETIDGANEELVSEESAEESKGKKKKNKSGKKDEKAGFFSKLGTILFGEDEEEEVKSSEKKIEISSDSLEGVVGIQEFTEDSMDLFKEFSTAPKVAEKEEVEESEKKKKKKKDKKEKVKKEKKPKPKKEKKPKKPKEPDNSPPLPKKPVILIFVMVASLVAFILVGTNLLGYKNNLNNAADAYAKKNYTQAYSYMVGVEIKEADIPLYEKYQTMALVASEYDAYQTLMAGEFYDMALDSLVRMVGRCDKFKEDAAMYGCMNELGELETKAENILNETFKMTKEDALELYYYRDRRDYSRALNAILKELGMEKVTE